MGGLHWLTFHSWRWNWPFQKVEPVFRIWLCITEHKRPSCPPLPPWSWVKFILVASMTLSNHLFLCHALLLLPSHFPNIRGFSRESSYEMAKVLEPQIQDLSFQVSTQGWFPLELIGLFSLQSRGLSRASSSTTMLRHNKLQMFPMLHHNKLQTTTREGD